MSSRGQMIEKGDGKWLLRMYLGRVNGKRQYASETITGTTSQAKKRLTAMLNEKDVGSFVVPSKQTVHDYISGWLEGKANASTKTVLDYTHRMEKDVYPFIGTVRLDKLTPAHIRSLYTKLSGERGLGARTIRYTHTVLSQALELAVEDGLLQKNPCKRKSVREVIPKKPRDGAAATILTVEQAPLVIAKELDLQRKTLWRVLLTTGLRPQEALVLKWSDLDGSLLTVQRALHAIGKGHYEVTEETKTTGSRRVVYCSEETVAALAEHKREQAKDILEAGPKYTRNNYIFATRIGSYLDMSNVRRWWKAALALAKLPELRLYDTRHTHGSQLINSGANPKAVAERLGHKDPAMTLRVYTHTVAESAKELAERQEDLLKRKA
jgi:integrase